MSRLRVFWLLILLVGCKRVAPEPAPEGTAASGAPLSSVVAPGPATRVSLKKADKAPPGTIRFAVVGDYGADTPDEARVAALVKSWSVDFVITTGDNNYPNGEASTIDQNIGKHYGEFIGNYR